MEVGQERVDGLEAVRRVDEEVGLAGPRHEDAPLAGPRLDHPGGGRADGEELLAGRLVRVQPRRRRLGQGEGLGMHRVLAEVLVMDMGEGAVADMQRDLLATHPPVVEAGEDFVGEVQPGRGRRHRAVFLGVDRLVARLARRLGDVGRQRHPAHRLERRMQVLGPGEAEKRRPVGVKLHERRHDRRSRQLQRLALGHGLDPVADAAPDGGPFLLQQVDRLGRAVGTRPVEPGLDHLGVVQDQGVGLVEQVRQVAEDMVLDRPGGAAQDHQPRAVPRVGGHLGDQLGRDDVTVKV